MLLTIYEKYQSQDYYTICHAIPNNNTGSKFYYSLKLGGKKNQKDAFISHVGCFIPSTNKKLTKNI